MWPLRLDAANRAPHFAHEQLPIRQARQDVVVGEILDARFRPPPLGGIARDDQQRAVGLRAQPRLEGALLLAAAQRELVGCNLAGRHAIHRQARGARHISRQHLLELLADQA